MSTDQAETLEALKPCPFCNGPAMCEYHSLEATWSVTCCDCSAQMPYVGLTEAEARAAWNNRPTITPAEPLCVVCHTHCGWGGIPANCAAWGKRVPATCSADVERLTRIIETLWDIIDDIDTADDIAKSDDAAYRAIVQRLQAKRRKTGITTDGQTLTIPEGALTGQPVTPTEEEADQGAIDRIDRRFNGAE